MSNGDQTGRQRRIATSKPAAVLIGGIEITATVTDLSEGGFRLRCDEPLEVGERFQLRVGRREEFTAKVKWAMSGELGAEFVD
jgi:hypothetical protein